MKSKKSNRGFRPDNLNRRMSIRILGLNSGTSADGLNAVLAEFSEGSFPRVLKSMVFPYPQAISNAIIKAGEPDFNNGESWLELHRNLGRIMGDRAKKFLRICNRSNLKTDLIASHGQTVRHIPAKSISLQLGDPAIIASATGLPVVADFRSSDIAAGGQGAPLSPILHEYLFSDNKRWRSIVNIGGISNITVLPPSKSRQMPIAADCGPGNMVIDALTRFLYGKRIDKDGRIALSGQANEKVIAKVMSNRFFKLPPPKSTGRELFGRAFAERILKDMDKSSKKDIIATVSEITVRAIVDFTRKYSSRIDELFLCGGGSKNEYLVYGLARELPGVDVKNVSDTGFDLDDIEALLWAYLAYRFIKGNSVDTSRFTGAGRPHTPGALWLP